MANYAETQGISFTPYRGIDVNLYSQIGQYKQSQYQEGLNQVNNLISNVAGLEVVGENRKNYLNSKVGELTSALNNVTGADWSNQQLISQAGSFASQIAKDPIIQNAVISAQNIKSLQGSIKNMQDKHPENYSEVNKDYDLQGVYSYLNEKDLTKSYTGPTEATPYVDATGIITKGLKEIDPTINTTILPNGQFTYQVDKSSKVTKAQVQNYINGVIATDPKIQKQLDINAWSTYRGDNVDSFKSKIDGFYPSQIQANQQYLESLQRQKELNPNSPYVLQDIDREMTSVNNSIEEMKGKYQQYQSFFQQGVPLESIKKTFYNDQLRETFATQFVKDNHEKEIKSNEEAIQKMNMGFKQADLNISLEKLDIDRKREFREWVKQGIDPTTGQAITPGSPLYEQHLASNKSASGNVGLNNTTTLTPLTANSQEQGLTREGIMGQGGLVDQQLTSLEQADEKAKQSYAQKTGMLNGTKELNNKFVAWKNQQELLRQDPNQQYSVVNGQKVLTNPIDLDYLSYINNTQQTNLELGSLHTAITNIDNEAAKRFPISGKPFVIDGLNIPLPNGQIKTKLTLDPVRDQQFLLNLKGMYDQAQKLDEQSGYALEDRNKIREGILAGYRNDPNYNLYRTLLLGKQVVGNLGQQNIQEALFKDIKPILEQRKQYADEKIKGLGQVWNYQGTPIVGEKDLQQAKELVLNGLVSNDPSSAGKIKTLEKEITPLFTFPDILGRTNVRYSDKNGNVHDILIPGNNTLAKPNPDQQLTRIIKSSYNQMTPTSGRGMLSTTNGKIRYSIGEDPQNANQYNLFVISGSNPIKVPIIDPQTGDNKVFTSPGELQRVIEQTSKLTNPATGQSLTPEEIIQTINNPRTVPTIR